jgi:hypothetical protein
MLIAAGALPRHRPFAACKESLVMSPTFLRLNVWPWLAAAALCLANSGCAAIHSGNPLSLFALDHDEKTPTESVGTCTVELRTRTRRPQTLDVPLSDQTRVQNVLDASRATSKFRNLDVFILRPTPQASEPMLKLGCRFDRKARRIALETDYAVLPGDRVVVREDTSVGVEKFVSMLLGSGRSR